MTPALLHAWLSGRSRARGLPAPVADRGGFRVDTRSDTEFCRWVFATPGWEISDLAREIEQPGRLIKLCGSPGKLRALLPAHWTVDPPAFFMQAGRWPAPRPLPEGYCSRTSGDGSALCVTIVDETGTAAASGFAAETPEAIVYDRIVTAPGHRRKGLGGAVMAALHATKAGRDTPELLVATEAGRLLYERLGWRILSPYATASLPPA